MKKINVLSLFDGVSCGQIALERIGLEVDTYYTSEIKENGINTTNDNYPNTIQLGNILEITEEKLIKLPKIDLLIGGSPCQNLSIAMKDRNGLEGEKSKLFFEYLRVLKIIKPKYFLLENVGSMSKENEKIITELMGVQPIKINSSLVSAQLRNRLYWTNINNGNISQPQDKNIKLNDILEFGWSDREKARCLLESDSRPLATPVKMFHRYYSTGFTTLIFKNKQHYIDCKKHYDTYFKGKTAKEIDNFKEDLSVYDGLRYLNQNELEQLQTLPIGYTKNLTRNEAAGVIGDGWTVDIIAHIFSYLHI